jgi:hypothetical protein
MFYFITEDGNELALDRLKLILQSDNLQSVFFGIFPALESLKLMEVGDSIKVYMFCA